MNLAPEEAEHRAPGLTIEQTGGDGGFCQGPREEDNRRRAEDFTRLLTPRGRRIREGSAALYSNGRLLISNSRLELEMTGIRSERNSK